MITISTPDIICVNNYDHTFNMRVVYADMPSSATPNPPALAGTTTNFIRLINTVQTGSKTYQYTFRVLPTGYSYIKGYIVLDDNNGEMRTVHVFQQVAPTPIWYDSTHFYSGVTAPLRYQIVDDHMNVIYEGVNHILPGDAYHKFNVNRIVADDLHIDNFTGFDNDEWTSMDGSKVYGLVYNGTLQRCFTYVWNWEYNMDNTGAYGINKVLNKPINGHLADWQRYYIPISMYSSYELEDEFVLTATYDDGREIPLYLTQHFNEFDKINFCMYTVSSTLPVKKISLPRPYDTPLTYTFGYCGEMALYYRNRLGGIDTLLIEGAIEKTDKFERESITVDWDNKDNIYKGKQDVFTNVNTVYKLTTGLLTDEQSETLVEQLIPSQDVLLFNPTTLKFTSVNITDSSVTYQTFKNNGRRFSQYTITVEESHDKFIK